MKLKIVIAYFDQWLFGKMGVPLVPDGTSLAQSYVSLDAENLSTVNLQNTVEIDITVAGKMSNNVTDMNNVVLPTRVIDIIDIVKEHSVHSDWMPPPPKKKWIRHYLLGEIIFPIYSTITRDVTP